VDAERGCAAIVSAQTAPHELHCYVPSNDAEARAHVPSRSSRRAANF
jgi:hypothetical protein